MKNSTPTTWHSFLSFTQLGSLLLLWLKCFCGGQLIYFLVPKVISSGCQCLDCGNFGETEGPPGIFQLGHRLVLETLVVIEPKCLHYIEVLCQFFEAIDIWAWTYKFGTSIWIPIHSHECKPCCRTFWNSSIEEFLEASANALYSHSKFENHGVNDPIARIIYTISR